MELLATFGICNQVLIKIEWQALPNVSIQRLITRKYHVASRPVKYLVVGSGLGVAGDIDDHN